MQKNNNTLFVLRSLSGKSELNFVSLPQMVFDLWPFKLLGTVEIEAIFASTAIHISKIMFKTSQWDT